MYAKLSDNKIQFAPKQVPMEGRTVINPNEDMLVAYGYLPVQYTNPPSVDDGYYAVHRWAQSETAIVQVWDILPDTRQMTESDVLRVMIGKTINNLDIPDTIASRMVDYYPELTGDGSLIKAGTKINWRGQLKKAAVDLWDTAENSPDNAPTLWADIAYKDGIRIAPETFTATNAAAMGELMWFGEHIYMSGMAGNVYTPEQAPNAWELIR